MRKIIKILAIIMFLNSSALYAESSKECMSYWNLPIKKIEVLEEVECEDIWNFGKDKSSLNRLQVVNNLNLKTKNSQWLSTGQCQKISYDKKIYNIYNTEYKEYGHNIWLIYDEKNAFAYFRKINIKDQSVVLSCNEVGQNKELKFILNSYLKNNTSVSMEKYKANDWYKE
ncbi:MULTISPECIES: hypothetical protein [Acinetobacter]|jgi:hypothetical protein|nr:MULTISPECIES: hypothetical protein [Acinetobacter]